MKILEVETPEKLTNVYNNWLNMMELEDNEITFNMFIEDIFKIIYDDSINNVSNLGNVLSKEFKKSVLFSSKNVLTSFNFKLSSLETFTFTVVVIISESSFLSI